MTHRLIFHIGLQKTGTSSIQVMLAGSQDYLRSQGMFFPDLSAENETARIWRSPFRHNIIASTYADYLSAFPKFSEVQKNQFWEKLYADLDAPILSAEDFSRQRNFSVFSEVLKPFSLEVVMYVRRQDLFAESLYNQRNKILVSRGDPSFLAGDFLTESDLFHFLKQQNYIPVLNFAKTLNRIAEQLTPARLHVRTFDRSTLVDGDVCKDFSAIFGWDHGQMFQPPKEANGSISNAVLERLKQTYDREGSAAAAAALTELNARLAAGEDLSGPYKLLQKTTRLHMLRQYADINAELRVAYGVSFS
jgi:hypothetical protein